ncbi:MAG: SDR family oxidoreductase [Pseudomonadota bacterium]
MIDIPRTPSFKLEGKRALVAGASSGIGLGCAAALADAGAQVWLASRRQAPLDTLASGLRDRGGQVEVLPLDVAAIEDTAEKVSANGPFDILINSAGLARHSTVLETRPEDFDAVMNINLRGAFFLAQAVARDLVAAEKPGSIITISSQMGHVGGRDRSVYCASKHAVEGFTKAMAIELGPHRIRVNTICPTFIRTPLTEPTFSDPDRLQWVLDQIRLGRVGEIEDIMGAAVYLASDASALVTGSALMVDGGWTAA